MQWRWIVIFLVPVFITELYFFYPFSEFPNTRFIYVGFNNNFLAKDKDVLTQYPLIGSGSDFGSGVSDTINKRIIEELEQSKMTFDRFLPGLLLRYDVSLFNAGELTIKKNSKKIKLPFYLKCTPISEPSSAESRRIPPYEDGLLAYNVESRRIENVFQNYDCRISGPLPLKRLPEGELTLDLRGGIGIILRQNIARFIFSFFIFLSFIVFPATVAFLKILQEAFRFLTDKMYFNFKA